MIIYEYFKIFGLGLIILLSTLIMVEVFARIFFTLKNFPKVNFGYLKLTGYDEEGYIGITDFHQKLGYIPKKNIKKNIPGPSWKDLIEPVKTNELTFRDNDNNINQEEYIDSKRYLFIGDEKIFGYHVDNSHTLPSCFERKTNYKTDNAGVYGYGAYQSVLRGKLSSDKKEYSNIIWSISLGTGFDRDKLFDNSGLPMPTLIKNSNSKIEIEWPNKKFHHGSMMDRGWIINNLRKISFIVNSFFQRYDSKNIYITQIHPNAANIEEIISFDIKEFSKINIKNKNILIIYTKSLFEEKYSLQRDKERELIKLYANKYNINFFDTFDLLNTHKNNNIYSSHFTSDGNKLICEYLINNKI
tara:strand:+ start:54 stop:1124 length:1071 start_codon:yes stop_codon:yes gene_type:complete